MYNTDDRRNKTASNRGSQISIHAIKYLWKLIYIYLLSYNGSITDIEHYAIYTAFGLPQTYQVI